MGKSLEKWENNKRRDEIKEETGSFVSNLDVISLWYMLNFSPCYFSPCLFPTDLPSSTPASTSSSDGQAARWLEGGRQCSASSPAVERDDRVCCACVSGVNWILSFSLSFSLCLSFLSRRNCIFTEPMCWLKVDAWVGALGARGQGRFFDPTVVQFSSNFQHDELSTAGFASTRQADAFHIIRIESYFI